MRESGRMLGGCWEDARTTETQRKEKRMAKVKKNVVVNGLSGMLGDQVVFKRDKAGRTILSVKPTFPEDRVFSEAQKKQIEAFREALIYARDAAKTEAVYAEKAEGTPLSAGNVAVADWFHEP
jgi:hypothetical protein